MGNLIKKLKQPTSRNHVLCHCEQCRIERFINDRTIAESLQYNESTRLNLGEFIERIPRNTHLIRDAQIKNDSQIALALHNAINK